RRAARPRVWRNRPAGRVLNRKIALRRNQIGARSSADFFLPFFSRSAFLLDESDTLRALHALRKRNDVDRIALQVRLQDGEVWPQAAAQPPGWLRDQARQHRARQRV